MECDGHGEDQVVHRNAIKDNLYFYVNKYSRERLIGQMESDNLQILSLSHSENIKLGRNDIKPQ